LFFLVSFLMLASSWSRRGGPAVVAVAMAGAALAVATLVLSARLAVAWSSRLLQSRRSRAVAFASMAAFIASTAPVVYLLVAEGLDSLLQYEAANLLDFLGVIPAGAPVRAAAEASYGNMAGAAWRLGVSAAWVLLLHGAWRANVAHTLVHPVFRGGGSRRGGDEVLLSAERAARRGEGPSAAAPARVAALQAQVLRTVRVRALRYWLTDPRYLVALVSVAVFPALFFVLLVPVFGSPTWLIVAVPVLLAGTIGWGRHNDVAHDSTALWMDVVSGRVGRPVMAGRLRASLVWSLPLVLAVAVGAVAIAGRFDLLPGVVGAALGVLGTTLGVSSVTSVALPYRAPAPGESPFAAEVGSVGASLLAQIVSSLAAWAVALPVAFPLVAALRWHAGWGWLGLVLGTAVGTVAAVLGTRWAGSLYDARSGRLLTAVT
jgi:ABC-2 type transport system permease protein